MRHLHDFIREIEPTFEEWEAGIKFLTDVGHKCTSSRQEFILLSDTLGASMLVDAINHRLPEGATETTVLGPFFVASAPDAALAADISAGKPGEPLFIEARVTDAEGRPLVGAVVDVWHSDKDGYYDVQHYDEGGEVSLRARFRTDESGRVWLWTIVPSFYPISDDGPVGDMLRAQGRHPYRPAHVHFISQRPATRRWSRISSSTATNIWIRMSSSASRILRCASSSAARPGRKRAVGRSIIPTQ